MSRKTTVKGTTAMPASSMFVCRTCVRDKPLPSGEPSLGEKIVLQLKKLLSEANLENEIRFRAVSCLNGCINPCNVAFRGQGRFSFRFGGLSPGDEPALVQFASAYVNAELGNVPTDTFPRDLAEKITSYVPPK